LSTPELDCISWKHLKVVVDDNKYLFNIVNITNTYIDLGHWLSYFKMSTLIIISKPNKVSYNSLKIFFSIVLLNTLGKLIKKVIGERLQYQPIASNFIYPNQLSELKQHSTTNADIVITHLICLGWVKGLKTSILAFDITQFSLFSIINFFL